MYGGQTVVLTESHTSRKILQDVFLIGKWLCGIGELVTCQFCVTRHGHFFGDAQKSSCQTIGKSSPNTSIVFQSHFLTNG